MAKNGLHLITPTSIAYTGTSATISANGSVSFSAVSSLSLNGIFSADYDNYFFVAIHDTDISGSFQSRLRSAGVDEDSASNYYTQQRIIASGTSVTGTRATSNSAPLGGQTGTVGVNGHVFWFYGPYLTQPTAHRSVTIRDISSAAMYDYAGTHSLSNSYDGLTVYPSNGAVITGRIAVYGMRK